MLYRAYFIIVCGHNIQKFYFLWQVHLAENLPQATHTQNRVSIHKYRLKHPLHILDGNFK